jgi:hypothetical protein
VRQAFPAVPFFEKEIEDRAEPGVQQSGLWRP